WGAIHNRCFLFLGLNNVYLAPGSDAGITAHPELGDVNKFVIPEPRFRESLSQRRLSVYAWKRNHLENVTASYYPAADSVAPAVAERVDVADPHSADRLGGTWYPIAEGFRWMPKRATVRMRASQTGARTLRISGYCPAAALQKGVLRMIVAVNGAANPA